MAFIFPKYQSLAAKKNSTEEENKKNEMNAKVCSDDKKEKDEQKITLNKLTENMDK